MSKIIPFSFEKLQVRVVTRDDGESWFVAADVCAALTIGNVTDALKRLDDDEQTLVSIEGQPGKGAQSQNLVNESGLYSLILGSRKPEAKRFKKWVTSEVLPSIRKTGTYVAPGAQQTMSPALASQVQAMLTAMVPEIVAAVVRSVIPDLVDADLSKRRIAMSYGKTSGQLLRRVHGIEKPPRGMAQKYSRLLVESGCQSGRGELGDGSAKVFDQEKASALWKMGHRDWANKYLLDRSGQMSLDLIARASKSSAKLEG